jgi:hypothetical protein
MKRWPFPAETMTAATFIIRAIMYWIFDFFARRRECKK